MSEGENEEIEASEEESQFEEAEMPPTPEVLEDKTEEVEEEAIEEAVAKEVEKEREPIPTFRLDTDAKDLDAWLSAIATILDEPTFTVTVEGVTLKQMDASHIAMVVSNRPIQSFTEFRVEQAGKLCFNAKELLKILGKANKKEDKVSLQIVEGRINVAINGKYPRVFTLPILEEDGEECPTPKMEFSAKVKVTSEGLVRALEDAGLVSDHVKIIASGEGINFKAVGDLMQYEGDLRKGSEYTLDAWTKEQDVSASYSLSYLTEIAKAGKRLADVVTVEYGKDFPMRITYEHGQGTIVFWLAPRIEVD